MIVNSNRRSKILILTYLGLGDLVRTNGIVRTYRKFYDTVAIFAGGGNVETCEFMYRDDPNIKILKSYTPVIGSKTCVSIDKYNKMIETIESFYEDGYEILPLASIERWEDIHKFLSQTKLDEIENRTKLYKQTQGFHFLSMYSSAGLSIETSILNFKVNRDLDRENILYDKLVSQVGKKYIIVHDKRNYEDRGYGPHKIDDKLITNPYNLPIVRLEEDTKEPGRKSIWSDDFFDYCTILEKAEQLHLMCSSFANLVDVMSEFHDKEKYIHFYSKLKHPAQRRGGQADFNYYSPNWIVIYKNGKKVPLNVRPINIECIPKLSKAYYDMCDGKIILDYDAYYNDRTADSSNKSSGSGLGLGGDVASFFEDLKH